MADNIKISDLDALNAAQNSTVVPVVDGGTTKKMSLSTLQTHLTASFVTPSNLSSEVSTLNSTINALTTDDIAEGTNEYFTNAKVDARIEDLGAITSSAGVDALQIQNLTNAVKPILNSNDVVSGSITTSSIQDFPTEVSRSAAEAGFGAGGGGGASSWSELSGIPSGLLSASAQLEKDYLVFNSTDNHVTITSASSDPLTVTLSVNTGSAIGGGGGTDYIENVSFSGTTLTFTGVGNAFNTTLDLSTGDLLDNTALFGFLATSVYQTDSASFASRIDAGGGGGGSVPTGTVSSSAQTISHLGGTGMVSSSIQIDVSQADLSSLTIDDITNGVTNKYYANSLVLSYLNSLQVASGSISAVPDFSGTGIVSSSTQVEVLGFVTSQTFGAATQSLQNQIDLIDVGVSLNDENVFLAVQKFTQDIEVTGSILLNGGSFSGSGANLYGIPAAAIEGSVPVAATSLSDGNNSITANSVTGITITAETGSVRVVGGNLIATSGSLFSGSGAGLYDIPGSAIVGGVGGGTSIATGSVTASVDPNLGLIVNSDISASGDITARSISVGTSGTPTIYSSNNLNLSASNAVVITDSPLRLTPFTNATTASFTFSEGDLVYSADSDDFYGYRVIDGTGSLISLTAGGAGSSVNWGQIIGIPNDLVSSSAQLANFGVISSSAQLVPDTGTGDVMFTNALGIITSSADFRYTEGTETLTSPTMSVGVLSYNSLNGPAAATGSFNLVDADRVLINNSYELPTSDGSANQIIKAAGDGTTSFGNVAWDEITSIPSGIVSSSVQLPTNLATKDGDNDFSVSQTITGSLFVSESTLSGILTLVAKDPLPTPLNSGSIAVSGSGAQMKPYFYNGIAWQAMF
jgi:hypothetical protein